MISVLILVTIVMRIVLVVFNRNSSNISCDNTNADNVIVEMIVPFVIIVIRVVTILIIVIHRRVHKEQPAPQAVKSASAFAKKKPAFIKKKADWDNGLRLP